MTDHTVTINDWTVTYHHGGWAHAEHATMTACMHLRHTGGPNGRWDVYDLAVTSPGKPLSLHRMRAFPLADIERHACAFSDVLSTPADGMPAEFAEQWRALNPGSGDASEPASVAPAPRLIVTRSLPTADGQDMPFKCYAGLRWGESVGACVADRRIDVPVNNDHGVELGEMRLDVDAARVLRDMLTDAINEIEGDSV